MENDSSYDEVPARFLDAGPAEAMAAGSILRVGAGAAAVAVYNIGGRFYATSDRCTHAGASLAEDGVVRGDEVECGWHLARFRITTGEPVAPPARTPLCVYEVSVMGGRILVRRPSTAVGGHGP